MHRGFAFVFFLVSLGTIALIAVGLATQEWTVAQLPRNSSINSTYSSCKVVRKIGLFKLSDKKEDCASDGTLSFDVYDKTVIDFNTGLQYAVIAFCIVSILCSIVGMAVASFNLCFRPYETLLTPIALIGYSIAGIVCSLLAIILYTILFYTDFEKPLIETSPDGKPESAIVYGDEGYLVDSSLLGYSFYLVVATVATYLLGILIAFLSEKNMMEKLRNLFCPKKQKAHREEKEMDDVIMF